MSSQKQRITIDQSSDSEPMLIEGLSRQQQAELQRRLELDLRDIGPYITWQEFQAEIEDTLRELES